MKKFIKTILVATLFISTIPQIHAQYRIMTYNIRYNNPGDRENRWDVRKSEMADMLHYYQPDIIGVQEALHDQIEYLDNALDAYSYFGVGRDNGKKKGEYAPILYKSNKFDLIDEHTYWLSETPEKVSVGWDAALPRIATFVTLVDRNSADTLYIFNCHYDHQGVVARQKSSEYVYQLIEEKELTNKNVIVMGDFNLLPDSEPIQFYRSHLNDAYLKSKTPVYGPEFTYNDFKIDRITQERLDYIFNLNMDVESCRTIDDRRKNLLQLSDHFPVMAELKVQNKE